MEVFTPKLELHLFYLPFYSVKLKYEMFGENKEYRYQNAKIFY
jgi:hypothetical protein